MDTSNRLPLVSIGVPVYNGGKYLEECLDSIRNQSYSNWECVISNNFSTDNTPSIAEKYTQSDPRFKLFHTAGLLPITENWNLCYTNINQHSKYFKLLPADDWISPDFISDMVAIMEQHAEIGICSSFRLVDKETRGEGLDYYQGNRFNGREILIKQLKQELNLTSSVNSVLYRNDSLKNLSYYPEIYQDESFHQDTFLSYELLLKSDLGFVFQILSYTRRHADTVTSNVTSKLNTRLFFREYVLNQYRSLDPSLDSEYRRVRIQYAYFLLKSILLSRKDQLKWHKKKLVRPIKLKEYFVAVRRRILARDI